MKRIRQWLLVLLILFSETLTAQSIALISDMNGRYGSTSYDSRVSDAITAIIGMRADLVISAGDMVAGQKKPLLNGDDLHNMWAGFNNTVASPLARSGIPLVVTPGNHDGSAFADFVLEQEYFEMQWRSRVPEIDLLAGSEWPRRYAARIGPVLLLAFDGTRPGKLPEKELLFIGKMLERYGNGAEMTMVFSHLPMWPIASGREHEILDDPELLDLLHSGGVDVYASGHHHAFFAGTDDAGMVHLGLGALGGNARAFSGKADAQPYSFAVLTLSRGATRIESRMAPGFQDPVPAARLPASISGSLGTLRRVEGPVRLRH